MTPAADPARALEALLAFWREAGIDASIPPAARAPPPAATPRASAPAARSPVRSPVRPTPPPADEGARAAAAAAGTLQALHEALQAFDGCALKKTASNTVFSDGIAGAPVMLIGEAPGRDEDAQGKPFVGRSGKLLDRMLAAIRLSREKNMFISNTIFWRPPGNKPPSQNEAAICLPFIERAVALAEPKLLILAGGVAAQTMLRQSEGVMKLRGRRLAYASPDGRRIPAFVILHPAYLLRRPQDKGLAWRDLLAIDAWLTELGVARD